MEKMSANSLAQLVHFTLIAGMSQPQPKDANVRLPL
jgi:hypothetical protein